MLGKRVLVTGCGPIGCLAVLAARRAGASEIVATDLSDNALSYVEKAGADRVINMASEPDAMNDYTAAKGTFDVMYECSGAQPALTGGLAAMRPRGVLMQLGLGGDMTIPMMLVTSRELDLRGSFRFHEGVRDGRAPDAVGADRRQAADIPHFAAGRSRAGLSDRV